MSYYHQCLPALCGTVVATETVTDTCTVLGLLGPTPAAHAAPGWEVTRELPTTALSCADINTKSWVYGHTLTHKYKQKAALNGLGNRDVAAG